MLKLKVNIVCRKLWVLKNWKWYYVFFLIYRLIDWYEEVVKCGGDLIGG